MSERMKKVVWLLEASIVASLTGALVFALYQKDWLAAEGFGISLLFLNMFFAERRMSATWKELMVQWQVVSGKWSERSDQWQSLAMDWKKTYYELWESQENRRQNGHPPAN